MGTPKFLLRGNARKRRKIRAMKTFFISILAIFISAAAFAESENSAQKTAAGTPKKTATLSENPVGEALKKAKFLAGKPKTDAKFYIFLYSASWCPPCRREMPNIAAIYESKILKNPDVELVHFSHDRDEAAAKTWAKNEKVKFAVVVPGDKTEIPGKTSPKGIPFMQILNADGTEITSGHGSKILQFEEFLPKK